MNQELHDAIEKSIHTDSGKIVISNPGTEKEYNKITLERKEGYFLASKYTEKQVFNEKIEPEKLGEFCECCLEEKFKQLNAWDDSFEYGIKISKKGKCFLSRKKSQNAPVTETAHNRKKNYHLEEGEIIPPLVDMGIFTKEGKIVQSMYDKYRQINKFIEIIDDAVSKYHFEELNIIDFGCGKSYLTFIVYYYFHEKKKINVNITGLDLKADVIANCNKAAEKYGYENLQFEVGDINGYKHSRKVDMVISLHACDTATDYALFNAICWDAKIIISVPCCQHELAGQLDSEELALVQRYGIIKERTAALFTDAIRGNLVECCGYKTQLLEFVDLAHTPKNILIRATKGNVTSVHKKKLLEEVERTMECFHLDPTLYRLLKDNQRI